MLTRPGCCCSLAYGCLSASPLSPSPHLYAHKCCHHPWRSCFLACCHQASLGCFSFPPSLSLSLPMSSRARAATALLALCCSVLISFVLCCSRLLFCVLSSVLRCPLPPPQLLRICRIGQYKEDEAVQSSKEFASRVFSTVYMGTENSSAETRERAQRLAGEIGAAHLDTRIDSIVAAMVALFHTITGPAETEAPETERNRYRSTASAVQTAPEREQRCAGKTPRFKSAGGSNAENLALQNIQVPPRCCTACPG